MANLTWRSGMRAHSNVIVPRPTQNEKKNFLGAIFFWGTFLFQHLSVYYDVVPYMEYLPCFDCFCEQRL